MRILIVHNHYRWAGGEDAVVAQEVDLLRSQGHTVVEYSRSNSEIDDLAWHHKALLPGRAIWAGDAVREITELITREKFNIAHFHNTFLMISPAAYYTCRRAGLPVVQTLHNYRLLCPAATLFRHGHVCEDCLSQAVPWPGVWHGCYRRSRSQTGLVATMVTAHRWLGTWRRQVDIYITPTRFAREKFIQSGLPAHKIRVKPHFVYPDPGARETAGNYALFVGRLSADKGVTVLLEAWQQLAEIPLKIVGDGPLKSELQKYVQTRSLSQVELLGWQSRDRVYSLMKGAYCLIFPSQLYETFGRVIVEAFACGLPVISSNLGALAETVENGRTGLYFTPGNPDDLAVKVARAWRNPQAWLEMGRQARREYETRYSAGENYTTLIDIYRQVMSGKEASLPK